jgi:hypothetical protein
MKPQSLFALIFALFVVGRAVAAEPWPEIPSPPKAGVEWIGDDMRVNGVPTRVMQFQSKVSRAEVVEYYRAYWTGGYTTKPSIKPLGPAATVISQRHGPYFMTVKVEDAAQGASHGLISVARVAGSKVSLDPGDLPLLPGGHVISVVESHDPGKRSREVVVLASQPPSSVAQFYQTAFVNHGWQEVSATDNPRAPGAPSGSFVVFAKDHSEMQLSIVAIPQGRGSTLVANLVTKDTGTDAR